MKDSDIRQWLLDNGGPSIRHRTAREFVNIVDGQPTAALVESTEVQKWLASLDTELPV
ncbi:MAG: hypothetical protein AB1331_09425 [Bacillota bacterium]